MIGAFLRIGALSRNIKTFNLSEKNLSLVTYRDRLFSFSNFCSNGTSEILNSMGFNCRCARMPRRLRENASAFAQGSPMGYSHALFVTFTVLTKL